MPVNLGELAATTLRSRTKEFADNWSNGNAIIQRMSQKGKMKTASGGRTILQELEYQQNSTFMYYQGYEKLNTVPSEVLDAAEYTWKQASVVVSASGLESRVQTAGKEAMVDLVEVRINNAKRTLTQNLTIGMYSDGTGSGSKQITGLLAQVAKDPTTGTVGGINRATWTFWRNQTLQDSTYTSATIKAKMQTLWLMCTVGKDHPDLIMADQYAYAAYWAALTEIQRITRSDGPASYGWTSLQFLNADVVFEDASIGDYLMYFLNTEYLYWRPHVDTNMVVDEKRVSLDQDAFVIPVLFAGNLTGSNFRMQGVLWKA